MWDAMVHSVSFGCNKQGGMQDDIGVIYLRDVVAPCFPDRSAGNPVILICDGHGSHLTLPLIQWSRENHFVIVLRVPHTSHISQGEDVVIFRAFKPLFRKEKIRVLTLNVSEKVFRLRPRDLMLCFTPAWEAAFSTENILKSFKHTGIVPFTRKVMFNLRKEEVYAAAQCDKVAELDYNRLSVGAFSGAQNNDGAANDKEGDCSSGEDNLELEHLIHKSRVNASDLYKQGPLTSDRVHKIVCERGEARKRAADEKKSRAAERARRRTAGTVKLVTAYNDIKLTLTSKLAIKQLNLNELKAILHCVDSANKEKHKDLKGKKDVQTYVLTLYSDLPEGAAHAAARKRPARQAELSETEDEEDITSEEEDDGEEDEEYEMESIVDACKRGTTHMLKVHWVGYSHDDNTWEPIAEIRKTQDNKVVGGRLHSSAKGSWVVADPAAVEGCVKV